jgi:hypothetical protein
MRATTCPSWVGMLAGLQCVDTSSSCHTQHHQRTHMCMHTRVVQLVRLRDAPPHPSTLAHHAHACSPPPTHTPLHQEYMAGGTLKQLVTREMLANGRKTYSNKDALDICLQMARGLRCVCVWGGGHSQHGLSGA